MHKSKSGCVYSVTVINSCRMVPIFAIAFVFMIVDNQRNDFMALIEKLKKKKT